MNDTGEAVTVRIHAAIAEIPAEEWDACAGEINPTVSHTFLQAMEESGSVGSRTGWGPQHISIPPPGGRGAGGAAAHLDRRAGWPRRRGRADLSQEPFLRRVCVRLGLGRRL